MKYYNISKYQIDSVKKPIAIYYCIFIIVCIALISLNNDNINITSSGVELATVIFLFITGLNFFKESFYFSQSNNVSRKMYFKGSILAILPISLIASIVDIILNRVYNLFIKCPTNYDMIFANFRYDNITGMWNENDVSITAIRNMGDWVQNNDIVTLFNTFLFQFSFYIVIFALGLLITLIYYKCNKIMKTVVSIFPIVLIMLLNKVANIFPEVFREIGVFLQNILGWNTKNPYSAIVTFISVFIILSGIIYLLIRKVVIKER